MGNELFDTIQEEKRLPLAEQVADRINQLIVDRNIQPDDKLPNEFELAQFLNVGRGTIREAEKLLVARNVLEIRRGKGTYVSRHTGQIEDPLGLAYVPDQLALAKDLVELRQYLEPWIAATAAERATEEELGSIVACCDEVERLIHLDENHLDADKEFHLCIARCTHNRVVPKLIPIITYSVFLFGHLNKRSLQEETIATHRKIADAICRRDPEVARMAMFEHVIANRNSILALEEQERREHPTVKD